MARVARGAMEEITVAAWFDRKLGRVILNEIDDYLVHRDSDWWEIIQELVKIRRLYDMHWWARRRAQRELRLHLGY